jgi:hypothetical protein
LLALLVGAIVGADAVGADVSDVLVGANVDADVGADVGAEVDLATNETYSGAKSPTFHCTRKAQRNHNDERRVSLSMEPSFCITGFIRGSYRGDHVVSDLVGSLIVPLADLRTDLDDEGGVRNCNRGGLHGEAVARLVQ